MLDMLGHRLDATSACSEMRDGELLLGVEEDVLFFDLALLEEVDYIGVISYSSIDCIHIVLIGR